MQNYSIHLAQWMSIDRQRKKTTTMSQFISITMKLAIWRPAFVKYADNTFTSLSKSWDFLHEKNPFFNQKNKPEPLQNLICWVWVSWITSKPYENTQCLQRKKIWDSSFWPQESYWTRSRHMIYFLNAIKPRSTHGGNRNSCNNPASPKKF